MNKMSDRINLMYYYNNVEAGRKQTSTLHTHTFTMSLLYRKHLNGLAWRILGLYGLRREEKGKY